MYNLKIKLLVEKRNPDNVKFYYAMTKCVDETQERAYKSSEVCVNLQFSIEDLFRPNPSTIHPNTFVTVKNWVLGQIFWTNSLNNA